METNNKLREALSAALEQVNKVYDILSKPCVVIEEARQCCREARGVLIPALSASPRNCDVGTASEQAKRFAEYCESEVCKRKWCKSRAKALCIERCALAWAQMPCEEGGAK